MSREVAIALIVMAAVALLIVADVPGVIDFAVPIVYLAMGVGIVDAAIHADSTWRAADQNKLAWMLVQLVPVLGTLTYVAVIHPKLRMAPHPRESAGPR
jgi:hypothetical protein